MFFTWKQKRVLLKAWNNMMWLLYSKSITCWKSERTCRWSLLLNQTSFDIIAFSMGSSLHLIYTLKYTHSITHTNRWNNVFKWIHLFLPQSKYNTRLCITFQTFVLQRWWHLSSVLFASYSSRGYRANVSCIFGIRQRETHLSCYLYDINI